MKPDAVKYLLDIVESINIIESHTQNILSLHAYSQDLLVMDAVERRLAIIGEALLKATKADVDIEVTDQRKIVGLRHILVHDYDKIDDASIWKILKVNLPLLKREVAALTG